MSRPTTLCAGVDPTDGCRGEFPFKDSEGLCGRCELLDPSVTPNEEKRKSYAVSLTNLSIMLNGGLSNFEKNIRLTNSAKTVDPLQNSYTEISAVFARTGVRVYVLDALDSSFG